MRLLVHLLLRIVAIVLLCLAVTTGWILAGAHRTIGEATQASADRAAQHLQAIYWQKLLWRHGIDRVTMLPDPEWQTLATARAVAPGICVRLVLPADVTPPGPQSLCSSAEDSYAPAPAWFAALDARVFGAFPTAQRKLARYPSGSAIVATADPATALRLAWMQVGLMVQTAAAMAAAISLLVSLMVARTLLPVRGIIDGLRQLERGDYGHRIARRGRADLGRIAGAVNALALRLGQTQEARAALTRQLFQVQEDERRALARDLHDEFGQCLAATSALAGSIEVGAKDRPDLVADARAIADATRRMMRTLKEALVRLRSQDIDELGLEACLQGLVTKWNGRAAAAQIELDMAGDLAGVPRPVAISLYRIAQECLTNATRHGEARHIRLRVASDLVGARTVALSVEDDGGGDPDRIDTRCGHGLTGIRERIAALGGSLSIGRAAQGIRVAATIPFALPSVGTAPA